MPGRQMMIVYTSITEMYIRVITVEKKGMEIYMKYI